MSDRSKVCGDLDKLHPYVKQQALKVLADCKAQGLNVEVFETIRTLERQKWLFSNKHSKTLRSYHLLGLAVDFVFKTRSGNWTWRVADAKWDALGEVLQKNGFYSLWKSRGWDGPHGQINLKGMTPNQLHKALNAAEGDLETFWYGTVNPKLREMGLWSKKDIVFDEVEEELPVEELEPIEPATKITVPAALKEASLLQRIITFISNLFRRA